MPAWAFALVLLVIFVISVYLWARGGMQMYGATFKSENDYYIIDYIQHAGPIDKAGIMAGDTVVSLNSMSIKEWENKTYIPGPGDSVILGIIRNGQEVRFPIVIKSVLSFTPGLFWSIYIIMLLFSFGSLYLLIKKPDDQAVRLFFIYIQVFIITLNAQHLIGYRDEPIAMVASSVFQIVGCFLGPVLIHFHLLFPKPSNIIVRFKSLPLVIYVIGGLLGIGFSVTYIHDWIKGSFFSPAFNLFNRTTLWWLTLTFVLAMTTAIYQYKTIKDTLSRYQLLMVITGVFFSCITPLALTFFYAEMSRLNDEILFFIPLSQGLGGLIMICCFLIAILRFRIWKIEIVLKKALLYLGATAIIILTYFFLLFLVDRFIQNETNVTRFFILAASVLVFLLLRDRLQGFIDRIFHRETYDSATVISDFEDKVAGVLRIEDLKSMIVKGLDDIFHFKSFILSMKSDELVYETAFVLGVDQKKFGKEFRADSAFEGKLNEDSAFFPAELEQKGISPVFVGAELIVPMKKEGEPFGFFVCGPKKSERIYSIQDIRILTLIAKRVISLFHTAALHQKDLDRHLMLERERVRISQDMHDDVGASLTRISILSEVAKNKEELPEETRQGLEQISATSREVMEEMGQIIWALNPKNDTLQGLVSYLRRFSSEYLEPTNIHCAFDLPEIMPDRTLTVEVRRNIYLVVREALHNVVRHSGASNVLIKLKMNEQEFLIMIRDDGKGFNPTRLEYSGNGLANMKKRMEDIGGGFIIRSEGGFGTEVELSVRNE